MCPGAVTGSQNRLKIGCPKGRVSSILTPGIVKTLSLSSNALKFIACATMLIDHTGWLFFPEQLLWRAVGRLSFPLFAFLIAEGCERTSNARNYLFRLLGLAAVSELPYQLFLYAAGFGAQRLNIFFTLAAGLGALLMLKKMRGRSALPAVALVLAAAWYLPLDYGVYGVLTVLGSALFLRFRTAGGIALVALPVLYAAQKMLSGFLSLQWYAGVSVALVSRYSGARGVPVPRWLFYSFYPAHLLILWIIWLFLNSLV